VAGVVGSVVAAVLLVPALQASSFGVSPPAGGSPPASPTGVALSSGNRLLGVAWSETSTGNLTYVATATAPGHHTRTCVVRRLSCQIVSLNNGVVYVVTVVAKSSASSTPSTPVSAIVGVPGAPRFVRAVAGKASATISWAPPLASGVSRLTSYMATASSGFACSTTGTILSQAGRTCVIPGLQPNVAVTVTVTATNAYGTGVPSQSIEVTPT
jgi:hypothetical protein